MPRQNNKHGYCIEENKKIVDEAHSTEKILDSQQENTTFNQS